MSGGATGVDPIIRTCILLGTLWRLKSRSLQTVITRLQTSILTKILLNHTAAHARCAFGCPSSKQCFAWHGTKSQHVVDIICLAWASAVSYKRGLSARVR